MGSMSIGDPNKSNYWRLKQVAWKILIGITGWWGVKSSREEEKRVRDERVFNFLMSENFAAKLGLDLGIFLKLILRGLGLLGWK